MGLTYRLCNFKAFRDSGVINIAPITVLCGENSSGKSSIIKSLLLLRQSVSDRRSQLVSDTPQQPFMFNGELTRLGSWTDIANGRNRGALIEFHWSISGNDTLQHPTFLPTSLGRRRTRRAEEKYDLAIAVRSEQRDAIELATVLSYYRMQSKAQSTIQLNEQDDGFTASIANANSFLSSSDFLEQVSFEDPACASILKVLKTFPHELKTGTLRVSLSGPFPIRIVAVPDNTWIPFYACVTKHLHESRLGKRGRIPKFIQEFDVAVKHTAERRDGSDAKEVRRRSIITDRLIRYIASEIEFAVRKCVASLAPLWKNLRYLGPLREQPRRYYQFDDTGGIDIGVSGEFTTQVLALEAEKRLHCSLVDYDDNGRIYLQAPSENVLLTVTNDWLKKMGLPIVQPRHIQQSLYELRVGSPDRLQFSLPDVGFGVSQILPIIVECLRANKGDTVILEQPEIHLHPRIQACLADFFVARATDGVRLIIESHSEYMIKRLCRRIAESTVPNLKTMVSMYFVARASEVESTCEQIDINDFGEVLNWPVGFFDSSEDLYWTEASLQSRRDKEHGI